MHVILIFLSENGVELRVVLGLGGIKKRETVQYCFKISQYY